MVSGGAPELGAGGPHFLDVRTCLRYTMLAHTPGLEYFGGVSEGDALMRRPGPFPPCSFAVCLNYYVTFSKNLWVAISMKKIGSAAMTMFPMNIRGFL